MRRALPYPPAAVAAFTAGLLVAAAVVRLPAAAAGSSHPDRHDCLLKGCDDIGLVFPKCLPSGECIGIYNGSLWKCYPVEYDSRCDENSSNGGVWQCDFVCVGVGTTFPCGAMSFYPCAKMGHIP